MQIMGPKTAFKVEKPIGKSLKSFVKRLLSSGDQGISRISLKQAFPVYLLAMLVILPALPVIRMADFGKRGFLFFPRLDGKLDNTLTSKRINVAVQALRLLALAATVVFDALLLLSIPWLPRFAGMATYYLVTVLFLVGGVLLVRYLTGIFSASGRKAAVWAVGVPMLLCCYYFCITAYSYVIYNNIPASRGGKYPTSMVEFTYAGNPPTNLPTKAYVLEESADTFYVIPQTVQNWFTSHEDVIAVPRSALLSFRFVHLSSGEPRINHLQKPKAQKAGISQSHP
ncbi:MAG: hypothetical protein K9N51_09160 [Candidatus Pacebacteria bacterium]|nr:hypothetical protein [Candidatus Paceibacterota bacterium]